jgi:hypothetical protein
MIQNTPINGNGQTYITSAAPSSDPVEAATILKVYYNDLLAQADRAVEELEAELAKVRAKRDAAQVLADQAAFMLERVQEFHGIEADVESSTPSPPAVLISPSEPPEDFEDDIPPAAASPHIFAMREEEEGVMITEDDLPPRAKVVIHDDGSVEAQMLPRFEGMKQKEAIALILEENGDRLMHRSSIAQEMFGHIEDKEMRRTIIGRVGAALTAGKGKGLWFLDPRNEGFYTCNEKLIKGNKKAPR